MIERDPRLPAPAASVLHGVTSEVVAPAEPERGILDTADEAKAPARRGSRTAWTVSMIVMGLLVGGVAVVMLKFVNGPVSATAAVATPTPAARVASAKTGSNLLGGEYFEMTYPGVFDQVGQQKKDTVALEQYMLSSKGDPRRSVAISVRTLESNNLGDDSSYKLRLIHPQDYKLSQEKMAGETVAVMLKTDNTEATLFWAHQGKVLAISATTSNPSDSVEEYIKAIKPTVRWRI